MQIKHSHHLLYSLLLFAPLAFAKIDSSTILKNIYVGTQLGETNSHYEDKDVGLSSADIRRLGFAGRAYAGYLFTKNFAAEAGFLYMKRTQFRGMNGTTLNGKVQEHSIDVMAVGRIPFANGFTLIGRYGLAYVEAKPDAALMAMSSNDYRQSSVAHVRPIFGVGVSYALHKKIALEASWTHFLTHRAIPGGTLIALGVQVYPFA